MVLAILFVFWTTDRINNWRTCARFVYDKMKDRVTKFEKFIADNEAKRRRAIQKYQVEVRTREQKTRELEELSAELEFQKAK